MSKMKLVIVGGVAGGATAAARARRLSESAEIVVFERGPYVSFANCGLPYHVGEEISTRDALVLQTPESLKTRHNLDVRVKTEVVSIDRESKRVQVRDLERGVEYDESYDKLVLSPGASPIRPPMPGIDDPRIMTLRTIPDMDRIKGVVDGGAKVAVVVGGGFIGLEMAENLRRRGLEVHLVELLDQVMPPLDREMASAIHEELVRNDVRLHLSDAVESFADRSGRVEVKLKSGTTLGAELVILAIGVRPDSRLAADAGLEVTDRGAIVVNEHMQTSDPDVYAVGDAVAIRDFVTGEPAVIPLAGPANRQARIAADHCFGRPSSYRGTQGTSIVRVFDLVVGQTGGSEKSLSRAGVAFDKVYLHPGHHVGYFPGACPMHFKLLFDRNSGRVLGAQISGGDGVDKRIDVIAAAIQADMTVHDLEEMELAYAPPFGAAKDPVNMAGFIAANVIRGDSKHVQADQLEGMFVLDVRDPAEHELGAIAGAKLIPLAELRGRVGELPTDKPIAAYCQAGQRGYYAARILSQHGFEVRNVSGGYKTYCAFHPNSAASACGGMADGGAESPGMNAGARATTSGSTPDGDTATKSLDVRGKACPGPIVAVADTMKSLRAGDTLEVMASDAGFGQDLPAWCSRTGNELISAGRVNGHYEARIRKGGVQVQSAAAARPQAAMGKTVVVFSNDLDRVMAALIIANGAVSMGQPVTLFFTFWGLAVLRKGSPPKLQKTIMERMFGWMLPKDAGSLPLSKMHMAGAGRAMMQRVMRQKNVSSVGELLEQARSHGVRLVACSMSMDVMGIQPQELLDGVEIGGVAAYLASADEANVNLFI